MGVQFRNGNMKSIKKKRNFGSPTEKGANFRPITRSVVHCTVDLGATCNENQLLKQSAIILHRFSYRLDTLMDSTGDSVDEIKRVLHSVITTF